jgi:ubiquinone/menaquinone biosynthesis C-methylase UbiE
MDVLELGCGTGTTALHHAPHVKHIRAVDISAKMLEIARAKAEAAGVTNVTFETASVEDLRSTAETYDVVMVHSLLHLLDDRAAALAEADG